MTGARVAGKQISMDEPFHFTNFADMKRNIRGNLRITSIEQVHEAITLLMDELQRRSLANNTLIMITSDHGESLGQHHLRTHGKALYRELIHVPLVIWYPGHAPAGVRVPVPVTNSAIPATIMDLIGTGTQNTFPSSSSLITRWQTAGGSDWPDPLSELAHNPISDKEDQIAKSLVPTASTGEMKSLVTSQWQFIAHESMGDQLYDWALDPAESSNLASAPERAVTVGDLKSRMAEVMKQKK